MACQDVIKHCQAVQPRMSYYNKDYGQEMLLLRLFEDVLSNLPTCYGFTLLNSNMSKTSMLV